MKNISLVITVMLLLLGTNISSRAQNASDVCGNAIYIQTNPQSPIPSPSNHTNDLNYAGFHTNLFDWKDANQVFYQYWDATNQQYDLCNSPFYSSNGNDYLSKISHGTNSDFNSADGWELIKRDMGNSTATPFPPYSQDPTSDTHIKNHSYIPHIVLYNRYTGLLRVIGFMPNFASNLSGQYVSVEINFTDDSPHISGLLSQNAGYSQALDQLNPHKVHLASTAQKPVNVGSPFYADFQMAYDACTCSFSSDIQVSFAFITQSDLTAYGHAAGQIIPLSLVNVSNGSGSMYGNVNDEDYLTSVLLNSDGTVSDGLSMVKDVSSAFNILKNDVDNRQAASDEKDKDKMWLGIANAAFTGGGQIAGGSDNSPSLTTVLGGISQALGGGANFWSSQINSDNSYNMASIARLDIALKGKVTTTINGIDQKFTLATPGSSGSNDAPEIYNTSTNTYPRAVYNEVLGTFALISTPTIYKDYTHNQLLPTHDEDAQGGTWTLTDTYEEDRLRYNLAGNLQYCFNPAAHVNEANTKIFGGMMLKIVRKKVIEGPAAFNHNSIDQFHLVDNFTLINSVKDTETYISPFVPIACLNELYTEIHDRYELFSNYFDGNGFERHYTNTDDANNFSYIKPYLKLVVYMESNDLNKAGMPNQTVQEFTYPLIESNTLFALPGESDPGDGHKANLTIDDNYLFSTYYQFSGLGLTPHPNSTINNVWDKITINANVAQYPWKTLDIKARVIEVDQESVIGPEVILESTAALATPSCSDYTLASLSPANVKSFCSGGNYHSNSRKGVIASNTTNKQVLSLPVQKTFNNNFAVYPNPFTNTIQFNYSLATPQLVTMELYNVIGQHLATVLSTTQQDAGAYTFPYDATHLDAGIYTVKVKIGDQVIIQKLVKTQ